MCVPLNKIMDSSSVLAFLMVFQHLEHKLEI